METFKLQLAAVKDRVFSTLLNKTSGPLHRSDDTQSIVASEGYINRCYLKLAEIDYQSNFKISQNIGVFVDLCAGPGGFTEYLTMKDWRFFGYAVHHPSCPVRINRLPNPSAVQLIGADVLVDNLEPFIRKLNRSASVVLADGAVDCRGRENFQEALNHPLIEAEVNVALACLRKGGHFILKTFESFSEEMIQLYYRVNQHFDEFNVCKPSTSRGTNSERYIVALGYSETCNSRMSYEEYKTFHLELENKLAQRQISMLESMLTDSTRGPVDFEKSYRLLKMLKCERRNIVNQLAVERFEFINPKRFKSHRTVYVNRNTEQLGFIVSHGKERVTAHHIPLSAVVGKTESFMNLLVLKNGLLSFHLPPGVVALAVFQLNGENIGKVRVIDVQDVYGEAFGHKPLIKRLEAVNELNYYYSIGHDVKEDEIYDATLHLNMIGTFRACTKYICVEPLL